MGFRIISFLAECLPQHPGLKKAPYISERSKIELEDVRKCLDDVALRIDEIVCNDFVDEDELYLDSMIAAQMEKADDEDGKSKKSGSSSSSTSKFEDDLESWVDFDAFVKDRQKERKLSESPTSETVETTGTDSIEEPKDSTDNKSKSSVSAKSIKSKSPEKAKSSNKSVPSQRQEPKEEETEENLYVEEDRVIRGDSFEMEYELDDDDESFTSYSSRPMTLLRKSVSLDFLKTIACEPVLYETDSEAADSWANGEDNSKSRPCLPSSSGVTPTADPARIAFRNLMINLPHTSILKRPTLPEFPSMPSMPSMPSILKRPAPAEVPEDQTPSPIDPRSPRQPDRTVSPTFSDIMEERKEAKVESMRENVVEQIVQPEVPVSIDDDDLDAVVDSEIEEYLQTIFTKQKKEKKLRKVGQQTGKFDRKLANQEQQRGMSQARSIQSEPVRPVQRESRSFERETRSVQREARRSLPDRNTLKEQNRGMLDRKLSSDPVVQGVMRAQSRDSTKKSVSFDESSISTSSSSLSGLTNGTPSTYTSLSSLRKQTGSQTSAFSAYAGAKQQKLQQAQPKQPKPQPQAQQQVQPEPQQLKISSLPQLQPDWRPRSPEDKPFDEVEDKPFDQVQDEWTSFDNFNSGSAFFAEKAVAKALVVKAPVANTPTVKTKAPTTTVPKKSATKQLSPETSAPYKSKYAPRHGPRSGLC